MALQTSLIGRVLVLTLNRPEQLNSLTDDTHRELAAALERAARPDVGAVVLTGAGRGFCAGQDLGALAADGDTGTDRLRSLYMPTMLALRGLERPVIAAINGACAGAGIALAAACDIRIASERARFVPAFADLELVPDSGASYLLPQLLGYSRAFEWLASGRRLDATEALEIGLVNEVVDADELSARALALAESLARPAIGMTKRLLLQAADSTLAEQLEREADAQAVAAATPEHQAALAAFTRK